MKRPPRLARWLLDRRLSGPMRDYLIGDLDERFASLSRTSRVRAVLWYWRQTASAVLRPVPGAVGVPRPATGRSLRVELHQGLRSLRRRPLVTAVSVATLGLGIGATTTAFSILWGTVLRGLPFEDAEELVHFERARLAEGETSLAVTPHDYLAWRERQRSFQDLGAYVEREAVLANPGGPPDRFVGVAISAASFDLLRVEAALGRSFTAEDEDPGAPDVVLLSHRLWESRFGADPGVVGRSIRLNGRPTTVVGVMPPGFGFPVAEELWLPLRLDLTLLERGQGRLDVFGRLRPGTDIEGARAEFQGITSALAAAWPGTNAGISASLSTFDEEYVGPDFTGTVHRLLAGALLVLLICCANVANLLLVQGFQRRRTLAVRLALGASRAHLVRQLLVEALLLATAGAVLGVAFAAYGLAWFNRVGTHAGVFALPHGSDSLFWWNVGLDLPAVVATLLTTLAVTVLAGLAPAVSLTRATSLTTRVPRGSAALPGRLQGVFTVAQVSLTSALLVAAGFVAQSVWNVSDMGEGFRADGVWVLGLSLPGDRYPDHDARLRFVTALTESFGTDATVAEAAYATDVPLDPPRYQPFRVEGSDAPGDELSEAGVLVVSPDYFEAFGVEAAEGRLFTSADRAGGIPVALVNERFAQRWLAGRSPLGARIRIGASDTARPWVEVVGVVPDLWARPGRPDQETGIYVPLAQVADGDPTAVLGPWGLAYPTLALRGRTTSSLSASLVREHVYRLDGSMAVRALETMESFAGRRTARFQVWGRFYLAFAAAALLLSALGLYGVLSFGVVQRSGEIGVRRALGATSNSVVAGVVARGMKQVALAVPPGLWLGGVLTGGIGRVLYGVRPGDPRVFVSVTLVVVAVSLLASWWPARAAARVDPRDAMRAEG